MNLFVLKGPIDPTMVSSRNTLYTRTASCSQVRRLMTSVAVPVAWSASTNQNYSAKREVDDSIPFSIAPILRRSGACVAVRH